MSLIKGKQIATGANGVATANLVDGILSADAAGRAKMATGFFDSTTTTDDKFSAGSIGLDRLEEAVIQADGGQAFTADQPMGSHKLTGLADGVAATDAVNKGQLDAATAGSSNWKELLLHQNQLLSGGSGGILEAELMSIITLPVATETVIITDGGTTETYTFVASEAAPFDVAIGSTVVDSMTNLVQAINDDSAVWSAVLTNGLDAYFAGAYTTQLVVYRNNFAISTPQRLYGSLNTSAKVVEFATGPQNYEAASGTESDLPASDPSAKRFGFGRAYANLVSRETHTESNTGEAYNWDGDSDTWNQISAGSIQAGAGLTKSGDTLNVGAGNGIQANADDIEVLYGAVGAITTIQPDDAASAGSNNTAARSDHQHAIVAAAAGTIEPDDAAAEGSATSFSRSDHQHAIAAAAAGAAQVGASAAEGSATSFARSDHAHSFAAGTPVSVGTTAAKGSSNDFVRADHVHDSPGYSANNKDMACSTTTSDGDQATSGVVSATPSLNSYMRVDVNGIGYVVGDGVKTKDCYFSGDGGTTARSIANIQTADTCHWNGSVAGFQLATSDRMDWSTLTGI